MKYIFITALLVCLLIGCERKPDDPSNAIVSGKIYKLAVATDSVFADSQWKYTDWNFLNPVESVQVWIERDPNSSNSYKGPGIVGITDSSGNFSIPVNLGEDSVQGNVTGYRYVEYADVEVKAIYKGVLTYNFGGGITLERGETFPLFPIALTQFTKLTPPTY